MQKDLKQLNVKAMGRRIRVIREARNITREDLAKMIDLSAAFIAGVEYGNKRPSIKSLYLLSQALGVTTDYLVAGNMYSIDEDDEAFRICEDIIDIIRTCNTEQLKGFRKISIIYADNVNEE